MHKMMHEKHKRLEQIRADQAAVDRIDETIRTNIQPCLMSELTGAQARKAGRLHTGQDSNVKQ